MIRVIQAGVGPLGQKVVLDLLRKEGIRLVGAIDPDPEKAGRDLGELCGTGSLGITIEKNLKAALEGEKADVAVVTTLSSLKRVEEQIAELASAALHIVSTCEELSYPWGIQPGIAERIDTICKEHHVCCLGTGVNPGFLMDYLPAVLTSVCQYVEAIKVTRVQDASARRIPFQKKIGAGLNKVQFQKKKQNGSLRHVGLPESVHMIARALGWELDRVEETLEPVMADRPVRSGYVEIASGTLRGVEQTGRGFVSGQEKITLHFRAAVGEEHSYDRIEITGNPSFTSVIDGGIHGDTATSAITVNAVASVLKAGAGLKTMLEVPVPSCLPRSNQINK